MGYSVATGSITRHIASVLAAVALVGAMFAVTTGVAAGHPSTTKTLTYHFTDCSGPVGVPASFDAVKQPGGAAALHLADGRGVFVIMQVVDIETGDVVLSTPGFEHNAVPTITCRGIHPVTLAEQWVTGILTSAK